MGVSFPSIIGTQQEARNKGKPLTQPPTRPRKEAEKWNCREPGTGMATDKAWLSEGPVPKLQAPPQPGAEAGASSVAHPFLLTVCTFLGQKGQGRRHPQRDLQASELPNPTDPRWQFCPQVLQTGECGLTGV